MTSAPHVLFVAWQHPVERGYYVVGRLRKIRVGERPAYEFVYVNDARRAQKTHDFRPFFAFPELETIYHSDTLFPFFENRILRSTRRDYPAYIQELGISPEDATPELILARSGGERIADYVEVFAPPQRNPETGLHEMFFLARGIRYLPASAEERLATIAPGTQLYCMLDFQNTHNPRAVALRSEDYCMLGYAPDYLTADLELLRQTDAPLIVRVDRVNRPPAPQKHRLLCRLQAAWPADQEPFTDERFQPLVSMVEDASAAEMAAGAAPA
jgi:hypothetical protein